MNILEPAPMRSVLFLQTIPGQWTGGYPSGGELMAAGTI